MTEVIAEIDTYGGPLVIAKSDDRYTITVGGVVRHPDLNADSVIGALSNYLHGTADALKRLVTFVAELTITPISNPHAGALNGKELLRAKSMARRNLPDLQRVLSSAPEPTIGELKEVLRQTRRLVSRCARSGFTDDADVRALFTNNAAISRVVPLRPEDQVEISSETPTTV